MRALFLIAVLALGACGDKEPTEAEREARVAAIEKANKGVAIPIEPDKILYPDIEKNDLFGASCAFAPAGGGMAAVLIAMDGVAVMKYDGEIQQFAPDKGVQKGPQVAWTKYDGLEHSLTLGLGQQMGEGDGISTMRYEARLTVRDGQDRVVYDASGEAQCGA